MKIIPLSEGAFTVDKTKAFNPFDEDTDNIRDRPVGSLLVEVQPFLVVTSQDVLLLDAGLGFVTKHGALQLHRNIIDQGIDPSQVTKVLMTHLHKDHSGGVCMITNGVSGLSFPSAKYIIQQQELELALSGSSSSYKKEELLCLKDAPQVELVNGNGAISDYIAYELTAAHSQFHQVFWIRDQGQTVFFGGDDAPQFQQMKNRYVAKYDYDGKKCMELRQQWLDKGTEEHWTVLFYHDIKRATITL